MWNSSHMVSKYYLFLSTKSECARLAIRNPVDELPETVDLETAVGSIQIPGTRTALYHDCLTAREIDLICGVFAVATAQQDFSRSSGKQLKYVSFWPHPIAWEQSGLNVGWWSPDCEKWFLKHQEVLAGGDFKLKTQQQWRSDTRLQHRSLKINCGQNIVSAEYLANPKSFRALKRG
ncbi:hypothetical protein GGX14DRAFT_390918 [Mycena pura]|uniref:Uncharacterized protein n=1 Tax=Mycena pura TaxID=153505 RepID=A0AAD6YH61_9AGAR|nr:hypothetical protein GGX14DRAFT_390918 [Mycena pura]